LRQLSATSFFRRHSCWAGSCDPTSWATIIDSSCHVWGSGKQSIEDWTRFSETFSFLKGVYWVGWPLPVHIINFGVDDTDNIFFSTENRDMDMGSLLTCTEASCRS
jgi:hypothetical protein